MSDRRRDALIGLVALVSVLVYVLAARSLDATGFPLDDAWIHQTYARNLAERGEWAFVPGEPSAASTSPLYTVLLAAGYALGVPFFVWAFALGAVTLACAGWVNARLAGMLFPDLLGALLWTGLMTVLAWHMVWAAASGMETLLFALLALVVIGLAWRERAARSADARAALGRGALAGLAGAALTLTRPDGIALVGLAGALGVLARLDRDSVARRAAVAWGGGMALGWLVGVTPYAALNFDLTGHLLPNTASAKQAEYAATLALPFVERVWMLLEPLAAGGQVMLLPGLIAAGFLLVQQGSWRDRALDWLPALWAVAHVVTYALRLPAPYQHGRYVMPVLPVVILYGVGGTLWLVRRARRTLAGRVLTRSLALSVAAVTAGFWVLGAQAYARDVRIINTEMVATARWVRDNLPEDELLAVHDIGAVGYYAPRPIFDLAGLVTPEVVPVIRDHDALMRMMCERGARYLMVLPDQRPAPEDDPRLGGPPIFTTNAPYAPAAGSGNMAVYALNWGDGCEPP